MRWFDSKYRVRGKTLKSDPRDPEDVSGDITPVEDRLENGPRFPNQKVCDTYNQFVSGLESEFGDVEVLNGYAKEFGGEKYSFTGKELDPARFENQIRSAGADLGVDGTEISFRYRSSPEQDEFLWSPFKGPFHRRRAPPAGIYMDSEVEGDKFERVEQVAEEVFDETKVEVLEESVRDRLSGAISTI